jgi:hypothetical protein
MFYVGHVPRKKVLMEKVLAEIVALIQIIARPNCPDYVLGKVVVLTFGSLF